MEPQFSIGYILIYLGIEDLRQDKPVKILWRFATFNTDVKITVVRTVGLLRALERHVIAQALQTFDQSPSGVFRL
jgi:hypothetical protein